MSEETIPSFPVKPGDWVERVGNGGAVAKVRAVYWGVDNEVLVDLKMHDLNGNALDRQSPAMGGPRTFEPACEFTGHWQRISEPKFPIRLMWIPNGKGTMTAVHVSGGDPLPNRTWLPRKRKTKARVAPILGNYDPRGEAAGLRLAAQELRDMARQTGVAALIERAKVLEKQAEKLMEPMR